MTAPATTTLSPAPTLRPSRAEGATLWIPLVAVTLLSAVGAALVFPLAGAAYRDQPEALASTLRTGLWLAALVAPVMAIVKGSVLAGIAWAILVLSGATPPFRPALGAVLWGEVILSVQALWVVLVLHLRGIGALGSPGDLQVVTGLNLWFPDPSTPLGSLALLVTPFHLGWIAFLAWRFSAIAGGGRGSGLLAAAVCWLPGAVLALART